MLTALSFPSLPPSQGELFLNGQTCRIVQRELLFDLGVAYGIDCLLIDPTLGGHCDTFATYDFSVSPKNTAKAGDTWGSALLIYQAPCLKTAEGWASREPRTHEIRGPNDGALETQNQQVSSWHSPGVTHSHYPPTYPSIHSLASKEIVGGYHWVPVILQQAVNFQAHPSIQSFTHSFNILLQFCQMRPCKIALFVGSDYKNGNFIWFNRVLYAIHTSFYFTHSFF